MNNTGWTDTELYLDWVNNFLTVECFAEYYSLTYDQASNLIERERARYFGPPKPMSHNIGHVT